MDRSITLNSPLQYHYNDVIVGAVASQIPGLTIVYSTVDSDTDQTKPQSSASLAFVRGIHRWPVNSPHRWPVTRKVFPFDDVIMLRQCRGQDQIILLSIQLCYWSTKLFRIIHADHHNDYHHLHYITSIIKPRKSLNLGYELGYPSFVSLSLSSSVSQQAINFIFQFDNANQSVVWLCTRVCMLSRALKCGSRLQHLTVLWHQQAECILRSQILSSKFRWLLDISSIFSQIWQHIKYQTKSREISLHFGY